MNILWMSIIHIQLETLDISDPIVIIMMAFNPLLVRRHANHTACLGIKEKSYPILVSRIEKQKEQFSNKDPSGHPCTSREKVIFCLLTVDYLLGFDHKANMW